MAGCYSLRGTDSHESDWQSETCLLGQIPAGIFAEFHLGLACTQVVTPAEVPRSGRDEGLTNQERLIYFPLMTVAAAAPSPSLDRLAQVAHALSDQTRLGILAQLRGGERCVCDLTADLEAAQSRLSFHLRVLREAGLVTDRRDGRWSFYHITPGALEDFATAVGNLRARSDGLPVRGGCCG